MPTLKYLSSKISLQPFPILQRLLKRRPHMSPCMLLVSLFLRTTTFSTHRHLLIFSCAICRLALKISPLSTPLLKHQTRELNLHFSSVQDFDLINLILPHLWPHLESLDRTPFHLSTVHRHQPPALLHCVLQQYVNLLK